VTHRDPLSRRPRTPRAFSLATELRLLAVGLFAVAAAGLLLDRSVPLGPGEVGLAAGVVVAVFVLNVAIGLAGVRRAARTGAAPDRGEI
jgi:hypothetical protein